MSTGKIIGLRNICHCNGIRRHRAWSHPTYKLFTNLWHPYRPVRVLCLSHSKTRSLDVHHTFNNWCYCSNTLYMHSCHCYMAVNYIVDLSRRHNRGDCLNITRSYVFVLPISVCAFVNSCFMDRLQNDSFCFNNKVLVKIV